MEKRDLVFNGKEKQIFATDDPTKVIIHYKDVGTAFKSIKRATLRGKGALNNAISTIIFEALRDAGIKVHFIECLSEREQLCLKVEPIPIVVVYHNRIAGTLARTLGLEDGTKCENGIFDMRYNNDMLGDPLINRDQAVALGLMSYAELDHIEKVARKSNEVLKELFGKAGIELVDFKMEFGRMENGELIIADELSPDNCRLWDARTGERLDKDRFRMDLGNVTGSYTEVLNRLKSSRNSL